MRGRRYAAFSFLVGSIANQHSTLAVSDYGSGFFLLSVLLYAQRMNSSPSGLAAFAFLLLPSRLRSCHAPEPTNAPVMHPDEPERAARQSVGEPGGNTSDRRVHHPPYHLFLQELRCSCCLGGVATDRPNGIGGVGSHPLVRSLCTVST